MELVGCVLGVVVVSEDEGDELLGEVMVFVGGYIVEGMEVIIWLVIVD